MWRVLVVDDDFTNRRLIIEIVREKAHCDAAANGYEALAAFSTAIKENRPYDIILLDIAMPDMDGIAVLDKIREMEQEAGILFGSGIPIIMVTAYKEPFLEAFNKGCDDYIVKPIDARILLAKMEEKIRT